MTMCIAVQQVVGGTLLISMRSSAASEKCLETEACIAEPAYYSHILLPISSVAKIWYVAVVLVETMKEGEFFINL